MSNSGVGMARINIEDQFFTDVMEVAARMGDSDKAVGQAIKLIKFAQDQYKKGSHITTAEFDARFSRHLMPEFAYIDGDNVIVRGASKFFGWLDKKKEAGAQGGVKSGESRRSKTKQTQAKRSKPKQTEPSSSYSSSSYLIKKEEEKKNTLQAAPAEPRVNPVGFYCLEYKAKYGHRPPIDKKHIGILTRIAGSYPDRWQDIIRGYLQMPDSWTIQRSHPVELIETKLNEIVRYLETGKVVTRKVVQHAEEIVDKAQGTNRKPRKSIAELGVEYDQQRLIAEVKDDSSI